MRVHMVQFILSSNLTLRGMKRYPVEHLRRATFSIRNAVSSFVSTEYHRVDQPRPNAKSTKLRSCRAQLRYSEALGLYRPRILPPAVRRRYQSS